MASLVWSSVWLFLMIELVFTLILVIPVPRRIRNLIARRISRLHVGDRIRTPALFVALSLGFALVESMSSLRTVEQRLHESRNLDLSYEKERHIVEVLRERKFRAQRNMYLAGFSFTLMFVIVRIVQLMKESIDLEDECERVRNQLAATDSIVEETTSQQTEMTTIRRRPTDKKKD
eukprot:CAMPEP_0116844954 /NCGR_PEP_ID=MMETSP0418-20121206/12991_1 /TAXON_ID=1158023 /ORGANISM="Astrosyne radiata, Strain 13vi08-1A" /LENGTH=175 /DNA_ID=CAMNT_0004475997 /DNA_START=27 /DNA_END=554 /DNA_ORIENTATION=+